MPDEAGGGSGVRILLIGLDGADWDRIRPMVEQGRLPNIAALAARGARGRMRLERPPLSPLLWTTLATARPPDEHGILDFVEIEPGTGAVVPVTNRGRRVKALWNFVDDAGLSSATLGWWATWPAERVRGAMVSDRWSYTLAALDPALTAHALVAPPELGEELDGFRKAPEEVAEQDLRRFLPIDAEVRAALAGATGNGDEEHPVVHLRRVVAATRSLEDAAKHLLSTMSPALTLIYFQGIDEVGHRFARYEPPRMSGVRPAEQRRYGSVLDAFYRYQDEVVGRLVESAGPETAVVLVSDHGFARGAERPFREPPGFAGRAALWHVGPGILILAGGPFTRTELPEVRLADIAPTVLAALGLPVAEDLAGRPLVAAFGREFLDAHPVSTIASYETGGKPVTRVDSPESAAGRDAEAQLRRLRSLGYVASTSARPVGEHLTPAAHLHLATVLADQGRAWEAKEAYEVALAADSTSTLALRGLFDLLVNMERIEEAAAAGRRLLAEAAAPSGDSYLVVARFWATTGRVAEGERFLESLPARDSSAGPDLARAILADAAGRPGEAERFLRAGLARDPGSWEVAEVFFELFEKQGRLPEAVPLLRQGLATRGGSSVPHLIALGYIALLDDDLDAAEDYLSRALEEAPDEPEVLVYIGSVHQKRGRHLEAARTFGRVLAAEPGRLDIRANHILALGRSGRVAQALQSFRESGPAGRSAPGVLNAAAYACLINGMAAEGLPLARQSLDVDPERPETRELVAALQEESGAGSE